MNARNVLTRTIDYIETLSPGYFALSSYSSHELTSHRVDYRRSFPAFRNNREKDISRLIDIFEQLFIRLAVYCRVHSK